MDNFLYGSYNHSKVRKNSILPISEENMSIIDENKQNLYKMR